MWDDLLDRIESKAVAVMLYLAIVLFAAGGIACLWGVIVGFINK